MVSDNIYPLTDHPKYNRTAVSFDMDGNRLSVGDSFTDILGNEGEIFELKNDGFAIVVTEEHYRSYEVDSETLLVSKPNPVKLNK